MDKVQAEAAADAILAQARAARKPSRRSGLRPYTQSERRIIALGALVGLAVGLIAAYVGGGTLGWAVGGAIWGAIGGFGVAPLVVWLRRVLTRRSSGRRSGAA